MISSGIIVVYPNAVVGFELFFWGIIIPNTISSIKLLKWKFPFSAFSHPLQATSDGICSLFPGRFPT